jgi:diguanylate cyclase (GGDEF)-like protein
VIGREEAARLRDQLVNALREDASNTERLLRRLDDLTWESGVSAHAALLLILTRLAFDELEARRHWEGIVRHREALVASIGRDVGLRVAVLDYFVNFNRRLVHPTLIDLELLDETGKASGVDPLTGLGDERAFRGAVQAELRRAKRYAQAASVVILDLDDFRAVRERVGDLVAERLLREAAIVVSNHIRDIDLAARPGDDEFALLLPQTDRPGALLVAERCRASVESHFARRESAGRPAGLRVSAGVATYPVDARLPDELLARAAQALYEAKASGKNAVRAHTADRRRFDRFDLPPDHCEVEVLAPRESPPWPAANLAAGGVLLESPEPLEVGETVALRLLGGRAGILRMEGRVVRLEQIAAPTGAAAGEAARFEIGIAFLAAEGDAERAILAFLDRLGEEGAREAKP